MRPSLGLHYSSVLPLPIALFRPSFVRSGCPICTALRAYEARVVLLHYTRFEAITSPASISSQAVAVSADNLTLLDLLENPLPGSRGGHGADIVGLQVWIEMIEFQNAPVRMTTVSAALVAQELPHLHPVRVALNL